MVDKIKIICFVSVISTLNLQVLFLLSNGFNPFYGLLENIEVVVRVHTKDKLSQNCPGENPRPLITCCVSIDRRLSGRDRATRTPGLHVPNVARYQLCYIPIIFTSGFSGAKIIFLWIFGAIFLKKHVAILLFFTFDNCINFVCEIIPIFRR